MHLEHTPALDERIKEKTAKLEKFFDGKGHVKWHCYVKNGEHYSEVSYFGPNCEYHAKACADNLYKTFDMVIEKIEKQVHKKKDKWTKMHRDKTQTFHLDPEMAWTYKEDTEDVA